MTDFQESINNLNHVKKILLINPNIPISFYNREFYLPIGLMYLASSLLKSGYEVKILDLKIYQKDKDPMDNFFEDKIVETIEDFKPCLIGWGCLYSGNFTDVLRYSTYLKDRYKEIYQVLGGIHATIYTYEILKNCPSIDFIILGEGEKSIVQLVNALKNKEDLSCISGLGFRKGDEIIINKKVDYIENIDEIPFPAYELVNIEDYYTDTSMWHNPKKHDFKTSIPIITSRSCPNRCSFCSMWKVMGNAWRGRSAKNVVDEIEMVNKKYNQKHFSIMDDNLSFDRKRIIEICDEIIKRSLDIQFETPNGMSIRTLDEEVLDALTSAGLIRTYLAIESGSDYIRNDIMKKKLEKSKIFEIVNLIKRKYPQLSLNALFIIGMPEDTKKTLKETYNLIKNIKPDKTIVMNIVPFPETELFKQAVRDKLLIDDNIDNLYLESDRFFTNYNKFFIKPYKLSIEELMEFRKKINNLITSQKNMEKK